MPTKPHFVVDSSFHTSDEVLSIPARYRHAAIGVWTLCGAWSVDNQRDGFVPAHALELLGVTPLLVQVLIDATLWESAAPDDTDVSRVVPVSRTRRVRDTHAHGVNFRNWGKWQKTKAQWEAGNKANANRQKRHRERLRNAVTSPGEAPENTDRSNPEQLHRNAVTNASSKEEKSKDTGYLTESATDSNNRDSAAATPGAELVREIIPPGHPDAVLTVLRVRASELIKQGHSRADVAATLELWLTKPSLGPNALPSLLSEVIKTRTAAPGRASPSSDKTRAFAELAAEERAHEAQAAARKELA